MKRRKFLGTGLFAIGATVMGGVVFSNLRQVVASEEGIEWGYTGAGSPEHWGTLSPEYQVCQAGTQQSPIDLEGAIDASLSDIQIEYGEIPLKILNNGHTIQVNTEPGNTLILDGTPFELIQFHFHHPSEHTVTGEPYPMEVHFVHQSESGELAVLGIFLKEGQENAALKPIWDAMPSQVQPETQISGSTVEIASILPANRSVYRYFGSLTTPPCSEIVRWVVFEEPIEVSSAQIEQFVEIFPLNARPVQPLNRRFLLMSN